MSSDKNKKNRKLRIGKLVIKDIKRFSISLGIVIFIVVIICILISNINKPNINKDTDISSINADKNSNELLKIYNTLEMKEKFVNDYEEIQKAVGMYILNNSTMESDSFSKIITTLNNEFSKDIWDEKIVNKPDTWNGIWRVDDDGKVKFKFATKKIEPDWINDDNIINMIQKN